jgi:probable HAF family extracellular repeat protein
LSLPAAATNYVFTTFNFPFPDVVGVAIAGINASGQVTGTYTDTSGLSHIFLYSGGSSAKTLDAVVPSGFFTSVAGINASGQIAGNYADFSVSGDQHAFLYNGGSSVTTLDAVFPIDALTSGIFATVNSINDSGQVAGTYADASGKQHFFVYSSGSSVTTLDVPNSVLYPESILINNSGQAAGTYEDNSGLHGFLSSGGSFTTLDVPGSHYSYLYGVAGINDSGQVIGTYDDYYGPHGFLYSGGLFTTLDAAVPRGFFTYANSINTSGQVAGTYEDVSGFQHGFVYSGGSGGSFTTLDPPGAIYNYDVRINDRGQVAGTYEDANGVDHGFIASPSPCPVTVVVKPGGESGTREFTWLEASFVPPNNKTLDEYAQECGFASFDWVQKITQHPKGSPISANGVLQIPTYNDPPKSGYDYQANNPWWSSHQSNFRYANPYYYSPIDIISPPPNGCARGNRPPSTDCILRMRSDDHTKLNFFDSPHNTDCKPNESCIAITTQLVGICGGLSPACNSNSSGLSAPLFQWTWKTNFSGGNPGIGGIYEEGTINYLSDDPGIGTGGVTLTNINGVQLPLVITPSQVLTTASGLAYSRVSKTFNGTVTLTNISSSAITGPLQILFFGMPANVTLVNATGNLSGTPYLTVPNVIILAPSQSATVSMKLSNPSNATINLTPVIYSGSIN